MSAMITIDGLTFDVHCEIARTAEIKASDISGMLLDRSWFNDVQGTYMRYEITIDVPMYNRNRYAELYEKLTEPVDAHLFILPYNNDFITITARVEKVEDARDYIPGGRFWWKDATFSIIANHPSKAMTLGQMVVAGRAPLPNVADPQIGDSYTYTSGGWVPATQYDDADNALY